VKFALLLYTGVAKPGAAKINRKTVESGSFNLPLIETFIIHDTVRAESFDGLRTGFVEAPLPFDRLRANGCGLVMSSGKINKFFGRYVDYFGVGVQVQTQWLFSALVTMDLPSGDTLNAPPALHGGQYKTNQSRKKVGLIRDFGAVPWGEAGAGIVAGRQK